MTPCSRYYAHFPDKETEAQDDTASEWQVGEFDLKAPALATRVSVLSCGTGQGGRCNQSILTDTLLEDQVLGCQVPNLPEPLHLASFRMQTAASTSPGEAPLPG